MSTPALEISGLQAWYGESHILHGVDMRVAQGEVVTLLGRNGAGRTTTLRAILGLTGSRKGSVRIHGTEAIDLPTYKIAHLGVGYCPEERGIFASLSCEENLLLPPVVGSLGGGMSLAEIYDMFPNLQERRHSPGTRLSGGEQQMLAVARILRTGANLLLLDEISEGLAPRHRPGAGPHDHRAQAAWLHHRHGRAEFPLRGAAGRSLLCHGARPDRRAFRGVGTFRKTGHAQRTVGRLKGYRPT